MGVGVRCSTKVCNFRLHGRRSLTHIGERWQQYYCVLHCLLVILSRWVEHQISVQYYCVYRVHCTVSWLYYLDGWSPCPFPLLAMCLLNFCLVLLCIQSTLHCLLVILSRWVEPQPIPSTCNVSTKFLESVAKFLSTYRLPKGEQFYCTNTD
jgi:hypothetical protein